MYFNKHKLTHSLTAAVNNQIYLPTKISLVNWRVSDSTIVIPYTVDTGRSCLFSISSSTQIRQQNMQKYAALL